MAVQIFPCSIVLRSWLLKWVLYQQFLLSWSRFTFLSFCHHLLFLRRHLKLRFSCDFLDLRARMFFQFHALVNHQDFLPGLKYWVWVLVVLISFLQRFCLLAPDPISSILLELVDQKRSHYRHRHQLHLYILVASRLAYISLHSFCLVSLPTAKYTGGWLSQSCSRKRLSRWQGSQ